MRATLTRNLWQRYLLPLLFAISLITVLVINSYPALSQLSSRPIRGVWMTINDKDVLSDRARLQDAMSKLEQLRFNTIYPVVWNSGYAMYPSALTQEAGIQSFAYRGNDGQDMLADLIAQAHQHRLAVMPWFEFGFMTPPTSELATQHPDWLTQKRDGSQTSESDAGEVVWLNPFHPEVQQFITDLVLEVATHYDIDGIQFDDHMSLPREFGYDRYTTALYAKETNQSPPSPHDPDWTKWRADKISAFMTQLNQAVKQKKPNAVFSISPNYYDFAYKLHLQDWLGWVRKGIVDELIVQVYRNDYQQFLDQLDRSELQEVKQKIPTGIGILTGLRNRPIPMWQIQSQARATQERGLGVSFFYYESLWDQASEPVQERLSGFAQLLY